jgi:hypothetical protein
MGEKINASRAWKIMIRLGYELSYPTALKWLRENNLANQFMRYGTIIVDKEQLELVLRTKKSVKIENRRSPGRKKDATENKDKQTITG